MESIIKKHFHGLVEMAGSPEWDMEVLFGLEYGEFGLYRRR